MNTRFQLPRALKLAPLALATALMLSACGGGGSDSSPSTGNTPVVKATLTGTFVDSPVAGLSYTTSSGLSGVTDADGHFQFKEGDTVTFSLAGVSIGSTTGAESITPAHLANGEDTNKFTNLLIMLQSLDSDGNPDNGITLPASLAKAAIEAVVSRLNDDPVEFEDGSRNIELAGLAQEIHNGTVRKKEEAAQHYEKAQGAVNAFFEGATGVWRATTPGGTALILRLTTSGRYVLSTVPQEDAAHIGIEVGSIKRNASTGQFTAVDIKVDTNGDGGLSNPGKGEVFTLQYHAGGEVSYEQDTLEITSKVGNEEATTVALTRLVEGPLQGAWSTSSELKAGAGMIVFDDFQSGETAGQFTGNFNLIDPEGSDQCKDEVVKPGLERGTYGFDLTGESAVLTFLEVAIDTNSCSGIQYGEGQLSGPYTITPIDGYTVLLTQVLPPDSLDTPEQFKLYRIKRRVANND